MKKEHSCRLRFLLAAVLLVILSGCVFATTEAEPESKEVSQTRRVLSQSDAESLYRTAVENISLMKSLTLSVESTKDIAVDNVEFSETCFQTITYEGYGTDQLRASVCEERNIGTYSIQTTTVFDNDTAYFTVGDGHFQSNMSAEAFSARYVPPILLDSSLYKCIQVVEENDRVVITFSEPVAPEKWIGYSNKFVGDVIGETVLDLDGRLLESTYRFTLKNGQTQIKHYVRVAIDMSPGEIQSVSSDDYTKLDTPDAPLILERACGYLLQAPSVEAESKEMISCDAYGDERNQIVTLEMTGEDSMLYADISLAVGMVNHNRAGEIVENNYVMSYADGCYRTWQNGEVKKEQVVVPPETIRTYCQTLLLSTVILPEQISSADVFDQGETYLLSFTVNESFAKRMRQNACQILYQDPGLLELLENQKITDSANGYLIVDKLTGIPSASGIEYLGTFLIDEQPYSLVSKADQNYQLTVVS